MGTQLVDRMSEHPLTRTPSNVTAARGPNHVATVSVTATIARLTEICQRLQSGQPLNEDLALWLGTALRGFLDQRNRSMQDAFGLRFPRGGVPWWREEAIRKRDGALRRLAKMFLSNMSTNAQAKHVHKAARRYAASTWRWDRKRETVPPEYRDTMREFLWAAFRSGAPMPLGVRQLRNILAGA